MDNGHTVWLVKVSPSLVNTAVVGQARPTKKQSQSVLISFTHHSITHYTTKQAGQHQYHTWMVPWYLAGSTYYHARVLHHHPWRAADSTVYNSSQLITTSISLDMLH